ncbi:MAG: hypothetical protein HC945_03495 [Nitrosarchaeum sp.]|nr:hypothetical protein [Nitrosarchaeum sp.]
MKRYVLEGDLELGDIIQSKKLSKSLRDYVRKVKKTPKMSKLLGENAFVSYTLIECSACSAIVSGELCPHCGAKARKRRMSVTGTVSRPTVFASTFRTPRVRGSFRSPGSTTSNASQRSRLTSR